MRPHWGSGGSSSSRTASERGATATPRTTAPAARLATRNPPLNAKADVSAVVAHSAPVPTIPTTPSTEAARTNQGRRLPSRQIVNPIAMAAPTRSACALVSVP